MKENIKAIFGDLSELDEKSVDFLTSAFNAHALQGFDYFKFKQSVSAMQKMDMDPKLALKSALATASTMGVTKEKLVKTAQHYRKVLNDEKKQFDTALKNQMKQRVASKQEETEYLKVKIKEYKSKITQLQDQLKEFQEKIDSSDEEIENAKEKIVGTKERFEKTYHAFVAVIDSDITNIKSNL